MYYLINNSSGAIDKISLTSLNAAASFTYDALNALTGSSWSPVLVQAPPTASSATFTYGYNAANQRTSQAASDNSYWSYPTTASTVSYTPNNLDQYSAIGSVTPTYDGNGNLTFDGSFTYCYDAESRLVSIISGRLPAELS